MKHQILCVDDEALIREAMLLFLENMGLEVVCVESAEECLAEFRAHSRRYDLILLNYDMPTKNGVELLRDLRTIDPSVRVALTSGYPERQVMSELGSDELVPFLQKPYNRANLRRFLLSHVADVEPAVVAVMHSSEFEVRLSQRLAAEFHTKRCGAVAEALSEARHGFSSVIVLEIENAGPDRETLANLKHEGIPLVFLTPSHRETAEFGKLGEVLPPSVSYDELSRSILRALRGR